MTRALNIYGISRIRASAPFNIVEKHQSQKSAPADAQYHEIESLRLLVDGLIQNGLSVGELDGFFFGFKIPQIGKEFDLLKILPTVCINIELKSTPVPDAQIRSQLLKNRHYLNHLGRQLCLYTVVTDSLTCYTLSANDQLVKVDFSQIVALLRQNAEGYITEIDGLFRAADYLVSPFHTPEKFIQGAYFLTQAQERIKKDLLRDLDQGSWFHLTGRPGTGKTLLLYDIAKTLAMGGKTLLLHCNALCDGLEKINREIANLSILPVDTLNRADFSMDGYRYILVDEAHRIYETQYQKIRASTTKNGQVCIFSSDPEQVLSTAEKQRDIVGKIKTLPSVKEFTLSEKIRTNRDLQAFIMRLKDLDYVPHPPASYANVYLNYANTTGEAQSLLEYYRSRGFVFINYSKPEFSDSPYTQYEGDFDAHHVIGQEFDKVVMLMDDAFYYDEKGMLKGVPHPDPDYLYPNLFYQGITRVREELAIIVVDAPELFEKIISIVA